MKLVYLFTLGLLLAPCIADQRDGSNGVPFLTPDPSLKTTDSFYAHSGCQYVGSSSYVLPPIFGGPAIIEEPPWMNLTEHQENLNLTTKEITAASSYELTEKQMEGIKLGEESWL